MRVHIKTRHINGEVYLKFRNYRDGSVAITATTLYGEPQFTATVALKNETPRPGHVFLKGWSENEGIPEALEKAGIVKRTGRLLPIGYCYAEEAQLLTANS